MSRKFLCIQDVSSRYIEGRSIFVEGRLYEASTSYILGEYDSHLLIRRLNDEYDRYKLAECLQEIE